MRAGNSICLERLFLCPQQLQTGTHQGVLAKRNTALLYGERQDAASLNANIEVQTIVVSDFLIFHRDLRDESSCTQLSTSQMRSPLRTTTS